MLHIRISETANNDIVMSALLMDTPPSHEIKRVLRQQYVALAAAAFVAQQRDSDRGRQTVATYHSKVRYL